MSEGGTAMLRILVAEDFDILREDLCETLEAQPDMTVAGSAATVQRRGAAAAYPGRCGGPAGDGRRY